MMQLYAEIYQDLLNKIMSGEYQKGDFLPTETEMEKIYSVSKAPIRQAVTKLVNMGLVERKQGKGTFVTRNNVYHFNAELSGLAKHLIHDEEDSVVKTLAVTVLEAEDKVKKALRLNDGERVLKVVRQRHYQGTLVEHIEHYIPKLEYLPALVAAGDINYWREFLFTQLGVEVFHVNEELSAVLSQGELQQHFYDEQGSPLPLLEVMRSSFDTLYEPIEFTRYYLRTDIWKYRVDFHANS